MQAVVAEVTNTPWDEQHCYVLDFRGTVATSRLAAAVAKTFHVSPFMQMDMAYHWRLTVPGARLAVGIDALDATTTVPRALGFAPRSFNRLAAGAFSPAIR